MKGKQKYSRDELIEVLKRNVNVFKDDDVFTQYIIDLAAFLVEYRNRFGPTKTPAPDMESNRQNRQWLSRVKEGDLELERVLRQHASVAGVNATCKMCGAPTAGLMTCPHCRNMAG
jgi:hypothetical protein